MNTETLTLTETSTHTRHIRSFVRRQGRITDGQQTALTNLWKLYGLSPDNPLDPVAIFGQNAGHAPLVLEIGFGMGHSLLEMAKANSEKNYIGIEVHQPGVGALLAGLVEQNITNVKVYSIDAILVLRECILPESLSEVLIYFPDPWHKKRHHKRRLIQVDFIGLLLKVLKPGGIIHCATDWEDYAHHMMEVLSGNISLENTMGKGNFSERPEWRPETKFERRGQRLGHAIFDLIFEKINSKDNPHV